METSAAGPGRLRADLGILWAFFTGPVVALTLRGPRGALSAMLAYQIGCGLAAWVGGGSLGRRPPGLARGAAAWLVASAFLVFAASALAQGLGLRPGTPLLWERWGLVAPADRVLLAHYMLLNPWVEEWFWRGTILGTTVRRRLGVARARALAVLGSWPLHAVFLLQSFGVVVGGGVSLGVVAAAWAWTLLRERSGHAWWCAASHQGADLGLVLVYLFLLGKA